MCEHSMCEHAMCEHSMCAHYVWALCVSTLCVSTMCDHSMCEHSMCEHPMCEHPSEHSMCVSTLTISHMTSRKKRTQRRSSWAECLGRIGEISPHHTSHIIAPHQTSDITSHHITHHKPKEEHTEKKFLGRVLGPDRRNLTTSHITHHCISPDIRHHISPHHTSQAERREHKEEVLGPSSWAGWLTTPHHISDIHISSHAHLITPHHTSPIHISPHQTPQRRSSASFFMRTPFKSIPEERKVRELPRKMNIEEVEAPKHQKKYEFYCENVVHEHPRTTKSTRITTQNEHRRSWRAEKVRELPRETRFGPFQEHRRTPKSTIITTKNEHRRSWRAGNYENSHTTPQIYVH